jgi:hypothetical protein
MCDEYLTSRLHTAGLSENLGSTPGGDGDFSVSHRVQTGSGAHLAFIQWVLRLFP